jgi:hypothetical protein
VVKTTYLHRECSGKAYLEGTNRKLARRAALFGRLDVAATISNVEGADGDLEQSDKRSQRHVRSPFAGVCTENLIRVDAVMESPKLAE